MNIEILCPHCSKPMIVNAEWSNITVLCPECGKEVRLSGCGDSADVPPPPPPPAAEKKELTEAEEKILIARINAIRDEADWEEYPAWGKGLRALLFTAIPFVIVILVMLTTGVEGRKVLIALEIALVVIAARWGFATFRVKN